MKIHFFLEISNIGYRAFLLEKSFYILFVFLILKYLVYQVVAVVGLDSKRSNKIKTNNWLHFTNDKYTLHLIINKKVTFLKKSVCLDYKVYIDHQNV